MTSQRVVRIVVGSLIVALVVALAPLLPAAQAAGGVLAYGDVVNGAISNASYFEIWQFAGTKGDRVQIRMEGDGNLDPYLGLIEGISEEVLIEDDDTGGDMNAYIDTTLPNTGEYIIVATRYNFDEGTSQGSYSLALTGSGGPTNVSNPVAGAEPVEISPGLFYIGDLVLDTPAAGTLSDASYAQLYTLEVAAATQLIVAMFAEGGTLDPYLVFLNEDGDVLAEDDDSGAELEGAAKTDALLVLTTPGAGVYYVAATRVGMEVGKTTGDYVVVAVLAEEQPVPEPAASDLPPGVAAMGPIAVGASAEGEITVDSFLHVYVLEGQAGEQVTITMTGSGTLDAYLGLMDANDEIIAEDDDSGGGLDAQISIRLPETATYLVLATRNGIDSGTTTGAYALQLVSGTPAAPSGQSGLGGFGGLPGRAVETDTGTFFLRGFGASADPAKQAPVGQFLSQSTLPGRGNLKSQLAAAVTGGLPALSVEDLK